MPLSRPRTIALVTAGLVLAFLIGFAPMWSRARSIDRELAATRHELALARMQARMGAALAEAMRSNYERSRQLMATFFSDLQVIRPGLRDSERGAAADDILAQRDEIITLLSRAEPESVQRLMLLYTRWFAAVDPAGRGTPAPITPSPRTPPSPPPTRQEPASPEIPPTPEP